MIEASHLKEASHTFIDQYTSALRAYLADGSEDSLSCAYELGRQAMVDGRGVLEIATIYHQSLATLFPVMHMLQEDDTTIKAAASFFAESLSPFEMAHRGFQDAYSSVRQLNEALARRARELERSNRTLEHTLQEKGRAEEQIRKLNTELAQRAGELETTNTKLQHEVVERQRAEEEVRENARQRQDYLDHSPTIAFLKDMEGRYLLINSQFEALYRVTKEQVIGKNDYEIFPAGVAEDFRANDRRVLEAPGPVETEVNVPFANGRRTYILVMFGLRDSAGQPYALGGFCTDITDRKRAEEALQEHSIQLEAANKELEAFSYSVSHDLRAPLRSIDGFSQILLEDYGDRLDDQGITFLQRVRTASQRMSRLIDDMLELSRVTRSEMRRAKVDLSAMVHMILTELQETEPNRPAEFVVAESLIVSGDAHLLRIALENLLGNAWKFTGKKEKTRIEFGIRQQDDKEVFFIKDNGAGFDTAFADKLFDPFQRLHKPNEFPGTGIGLATVQRILQRHGGQIWAESVVGEGATFYFTL